MIDNQKRYFFVRALVLVVISTFASTCALCIALVDYKHFEPLLMGVALLVAWSMTAMAVYVAMLACCTKTEVEVGQKAQLVRILRDFRHQHGLPPEECLDPTREA